MAVVASIAAGAPPRVTASANEITSYVSNGRTELLASALLWAASAGLVVWFAAAFAEGALAYGADTRTAALTVTLFEGLMVLNTMIGFAAALPLTAAGIGVLRTHLMPDWLGYVALAAAAVSVVGAFGIFAESGNYVPGGPVMSFVSLSASGIFVICASAFMVREHLPEVAPMTLSQT